MRKNLFIFLAIGLCFILNGCNTSKEDPVNNDVVKVESIEVIGKTELKVDELLTLAINVLPNNATNKEVIISSSDNEILTVDEFGNVKAVKSGKATITVLSKENNIISNKIEINVVLSNIDITINSTDFELEVGENAKIDYSTTDNSIATFKSSDEQIVTVDVDGNVLAIKPGETTIKLSTLTETKEIKVTVKTPVLELTCNKDILFVGEEITINSKISSINDPIIWSTSDSKIATVKNGVLTAIAEGSVTITARSNSGVEKAISFTVDSLKLIIKANVEEAYLDSTIKLTATIYPMNIEEKVIWSPITNRAEIDEDGNVTILQSGKAGFKATSTTFDNLTAAFTIEIAKYIDPVKFFSSLNIINPVIKTINVTGYQFVYEYLLMGSVYRYSFTPLNVIEAIVPEGSSNRPGTSNNGNIFKVLYITVHDTASSAASAGAAAHSSYVNQGGGGTSWHYSSGDDAIYHQIPNNEVAYHAGDGTGTPLTFTDTGLKAEGQIPAKVTISEDGYYELNGVKSKIEVPRKTDGSIPTNANLPYTGINTKVGDNGNFYIGSTWWSKTYNSVGNFGGNLNSIGIETMVNKGSNVYLTWCNTAKLIGSQLLSQNGLTPLAVKQHNTFSGKNCPQTMREANMWEEFIKMVEAEYNYFIYFRSWKVSFSCNNTELLNNRGLIIKQPDVDTEVTYTITINDNNGYVKEINLSSTIPGKN